MNSSDIIFPVLGPHSASQLHGYHFVPLIEAPSFFYTIQKDRRLVARTIIFIRLFLATLELLFFSLLRRSQNKLSRGRRGV